MDPNFYRTYECNIQCPKLSATQKFRCPNCKVDTLEADSVTTTSFTMNGVETHAGSFPLSTTHVFTSTELPVLANRQCNGEFVFYLNNDLYVGVGMTALVKSAGSILQVLLYQKLRNFTTVNVSF